MDIQDMVDARIRKLSGQALSIDAVLQTHKDKSPAGIIPDKEILKYSETVDSTLSEISRRVLDITEQVSGDYGRLEKELLKSRLDLLRSAEMVLDMALSLKKRSRMLVTTPRDASRQNAGGEWPLMAVEQAQGGNGRASLYNNDGVADLFRRT